MKKLLQGGLGMLAVAVMVLLFGAGAQAEKMATVDTAKVVKEYEKTKEAQTRLEKDLDDKKNELKGLNDELTKLRTELETQKGILSEAKYKKLQEKFTSKQDIFKEKYQESQTSLMTKQRALMEGIVGDIKRIVEEIAKAEKFDLVLDKETVLYVNGDDITYKVLDKLNKKAK